MAGLIYQKTTENIENIMEHSMTRISISDIKYKNFPTTIDFAKINIDLERISLFDQYTITLCLHTEIKLLANVRIVNSIGFYNTKDVDFTVNEVSIDIGYGCLTDEAQEFYYDLFGGLGDLDLSDISEDDIDMDKVKSKLVESLLIFKREILFLNTDFSLEEYEINGLHMKLEIDKDFVKKNFEQLIEETNSITYMTYIPNEDAKTSDNWNAILNYMRAYIIKKSETTKITWNYLNECYITSNTEYLPSGQKDEIDIDEQIRYEAVTDKWLRNQIDV